MWETNFFFFNTHIHQCDRESKRRQSVSLPTEHLPFEGLVLAPSVQYCKTWRKNHSQVLLPGQDRYLLYLFHSEDTFSGKFLTRKLKFKLPLFLQPPLLNPALCEPDVRSLPFSTNDVRDQDGHAGDGRGCAGQTRLPCIGTLEKSFRKGGVGQDMQVRESGGQ